MRSVCIVTAWLIGVLLIAPGCSKSDEEPITPPDTSGHLYYAGLWRIYKDVIPGNWTWHRTIVRYALVGTPDTVYLLDTVQTTPIDLVNDSTLNLDGVLLSYSDSVHYKPGYGSRVDTANQVHYWHEGSYRWNGAWSYDLTLDRHNDSLVYVINKTGSALGYTLYETWKTKVSP